MTGLVVDLYAGGGGGSVGMEAALRRPVDIAINHSKTALAVHEANHPRTTHFVSDLFEVEPRMATHGRSVFAIWASPSCVFFSRARAGLPKNNQERSHADVVIKWVEQTNPQLLFLENVTEFLSWGPLYPDDYPIAKLRNKPIPERKGEDFIAWKQKLEALGYSVDWRVLNSADYGAPTSRKRLFVVARRDGQPIAWPTPTHGLGLIPYRSAAECIDWSLPIPSIFDRKKALAEKTHERIAEGVRRYVIESSEPFLAPLTTVVAESVKHAAVAAFITKHYSGVFGQPLTLPTGTITATDHHALTAVTLAKFRGTAANQPMSCDIRAPLPTISAGGVHVAAVAALLSKFGVTPKPIMIGDEAYGIADIGMRMLKPHELLLAQFGSFADGYDISAAKTDEKKVRLIGNSVPPEVVQALVAANVRVERAVAA